MAPRPPAFLLLGILLLAAPPLIPAAAQEAPTSALPPRELFLQPFPDMFTPGNVTTFTPTDLPLPQRPHPIDQETQRIHWSWWVDHLPAPWVLEEGSAIEFVVYLANLDQTLPPVDVLAHPDSVGQARLIARIDHLGERDPPAQGSVDVPTATSVADGAIVELRIPMTASRTVVYPTRAPPGSDVPLFGLNLTLIAVASNRAFPAVHVDTDAPSRVHIAGFPMTELRAWEAAERARIACNDAILRGEECVLDADAPIEDDVAPTPAPAVVASIAALLLMAAAARRAQAQQGRQVSPFDDV